MGSGFSRKRVYQCSYGRASAYVGGQNLLTSDVIYHQDDELVLGDRKGDIFQVMQPSAANGDLSSHLASSDLQGR